MKELTERLFECQHCRTDFWATRPAKYCSSKCRTAAHRARQKPTLLKALVDNNPALIEDWNIVRQLSTFAERLIKEIYDRYGYDAARMAIKAAYATYENLDIMTEADHQARETKRANEIVEVKRHL